MPHSFSAIRAQLGLLFAVAVLAATALWGSAAYVEGRIVANADKSFVAKDIVADILPPTMYLIEARLTLSRAAEGSYSPSEAVSTLARLEADYQARVKYWQENPPFGLETFPLGEQHRTAEAFWTYVRSDVLPALQARDAVAARQTIPRAQELYQLHRTAVDDTVVASVAFAEGAIADMERVKAKAFWVSTVGLAAVIATLMALSLLGLSLALL